MALIETLDTAILRRAHECTEEIANQYRRAVRPLYGSERGEAPELIGSCILLAREGRKYVATAAHNIDWTETHGLYVGGEVGTQPVQITGAISASRKPQGERDLDPYDCAAWPIDTTTEQALGQVDYIDESRVSHNLVNPEHRIYLAMGYPLSKNKKSVNERSATITPTSWKYSANVVACPPDMDMPGVSDSTHFFLKYAKFSQTGDGDRVPSLKPQGLSGGAFVDLGSFVNPDKFLETGCTGMLAGMPIIFRKKFGVVIAVKAEVMFKAVEEASQL